MFPTLNQVTAGGGLALEDYVALAARHGFIGVDFSIQEVAKHVAQNGFESTAALFESHKVLPATFGLPVEWRKDEDTFQQGLAQLPELAKLAQDLDCSRCVTWVLPDSGEPVAEYASRSQRRLIETAKVLQEQGVRLGLEFLGPQHFRKNPDNVWFYDIPGALQVVGDMAEQGKLENLGLLVDCWHWYTGGGSTMDLASIPIEQVVHVHINDAPNVPRESQIDNVRLLPGASGVIDIVGFMKTLAAIGYDGPVAVETFSEELKQLTPDEAASRAGIAVANVFKAAEIEPLRLV
jgi:sugar phosphate isomerase/epimerase